MRHKMLKNLTLYAKFEIISVHQIKNNLSGEAARPNCVLVASSIHSAPSERDFFFKFCQEYSTLISTAVIKLTYILYLFILCGFGGLGVACWPLVPKFAGSNPAEADGFLRAKKSSARLPSEGK